MIVSEEDQSRENYLEKWSSKSQWSKLECSPVLKGVMDRMDEGWLRQ